MIPTKCFPYAIEPEDALPYQTVPEMKTEGEHCHKDVTFPSQNGHEDLEPSAASNESITQCPGCHSEALYKYGKTKTGKQRFLCLICGRQFTKGSSDSRTKNRPRCPNCQKLMHVYKKENNAVRFRCSDYPQCRTFRKIRTGEES